jgi:sigma-54 dependent transcriptional regulator, acetoin dehydrogenase operon transcriptional activator AcoR
MQPLTQAPAAQRLAQIDQARQAVLREGAHPAAQLAPWLGRSWQRCLGRGQAPQQRLTFDTVNANGVAQALERNQPLLNAARPVIASLAQAVSDTRYFALLTDAHGVVIDINGPVDRHDPRATSLARLGVDLSEVAVGTTAIGATLAELQPVWLHRGEHFFDDTAMYSCAGAPVFGADGLCAGMLDLTGIEVPERPALRHLVTQSARRIENALVQARAHHLLVRLNWPGQPLGSESDGLLAVDGHGNVVGFNPAAADMLALQPGGLALHLEQLFATPSGHLFDQARHQRAAQELPLWSGLRLQVLATQPGQASRWSAHTPSSRPEGDVPLKDVEASLIRRAIDTHRGNVAAAAKALGISRATVYRKLGKHAPK